MVPSWCNDAVIVKRAAMVDKRGTMVRDWANAVSHQVSGCSVQPGGTTLDLSQQRIATTAKWTVYAPPNSDVQTADKVVWNGTEYAIDGGPQTWKSPSGNQDHMVLSLIDWSG
jgi:hypothetical protein